MSAANGGKYDRDWLHSFALATRELTLDNALPNSCILSTRIGLEVLDRFGIKARPQPVIAVAFNGVAARLRFATPEVPLAQWPETAWSVGIAGTGVTDLDNKNWDGHLVIIVRHPNRKRTLIDLTADQMDRPARNIDIPGPIFMDLPSVWTPRDAAYTVSDATGTVVGYQPLVNAGDWQTSPDWTKDVSRYADELCAQLGSQWVKNAVSH